MCVDCRLSVHKRCLAQANQSRECGKVFYGKKAKKGGPKDKSGFKVFGAPLEDVLSLPGNEESNIPVVIAQAIQYIEDNGLGTEGIFRVSPSIAEVDEVKGKIEKGEPVDYSAYMDGVNIAANVVKHFLRDLPEPLVTTERYRAFLAVMDRPEGEQLGLVRELVRQLPVPNQTLLCCIVDLIQRVAQNSDRNLMGISNMVTMLAPLILWSKEPMDPSSVLKETNSFIGVTRLLVDKQALIFGKKDADQTESTPNLLGKPLH